jgi:hypothetical protein
MECLYHYTSLENLALILSNKTICLNNLLYVDDREEAESEDMTDIGKFVYVSCWTDDAKESIPLWNLYTPNMHGVRICLPKFPFKKYHYKKGDLFFTEDVETYINLKKIYDENLISVTSDALKLIKVEYTDEKEKLLPVVRTESDKDFVKRYLEAKDLKELEEGRIQYSFEYMGKFKNKNWEFQNEWRYKIVVSPMGLRESNPLTLQKQQERIRRIEDSNTEPPCKRLFLDINESAFNNMEIVFGPRMSEAEKILAKSLINQYAPNCTYRDSSLRIR